jgi:hypothetical protein
MLRGCPSSPASTPAFWTLREYLAELWVILVFVDVVYSDMSLKIVRPGIFVLSVGTEWADIAGRLMY